MTLPPAAPETFDQFLARLEEGHAAGSHDGAPAPWSAQVIGALYDGQDAATAAKWARRVHGELARLDGPVPFAVVHDWHASTVAPLLAETAARRGDDAGAQEAVRALHVRALAGERVGAEAWEAALGAALAEVYQHAYAYDEAFATASADAHAYAMANDYGEQKAAEFADSYGKLSAGANARSYAAANALANARAAAAAYATADARAYAETYPFAYVRAYILALADGDCAEGQRDAGAQEERRREACAQLADGLADSLGRAAA
ncbi:SpcZ [Streptomyces sp. NPDC050610]|uniref:SpcZ n=1 Tax=Streptomyces sp. NPDC050610 TaxID=3157097 RepID=UPI00343ECF12